ncbi:unnamed protein product [Microthlaspi erraticum]|uniref:Uncharacterized protein n=1 Tax=Microthlaspi erraticum TaxID=1685480 RepID=A0A6D2I789_9BRAS|nr:unnamed protein product [Microthlaspi erraticum]
MTIGDRPLKLPSHQKYRSTERNKMINPENQNMKSLIWDLPRAFNCFDRVHGVALKKDSFQFFFKWVEKPPDDYLTILPVWVRLYEVPVNYYTEATITDIAEVIGQVIEVAFDPEKPQNQRYVRARVLFNTSKPLCNFKTVELPEGDVVTVMFETPAPAKVIAPVVTVVQTPRLQPNDPLFGVLTQVGLDSNTCKWKIANEVLDVARQYLQKTLLRLEPAPILSTNVNKGKGLVFHFPEQNVSEERGDRLMRDAQLSGGRSNLELLRSMELAASTESSFADCSTGFRVGTSGASSSGTGTAKKKKYRKRPQSITRKSQKRDATSTPTETEQQQSSGQQESSHSKKKAEEAGEVSAKCIKRDQTRVDPIDLPKIK